MEVETSNKVGNANINVIALDWGAWGKIKAEIEIEEDAWMPIYTKEGEGYITIPLDERGGIDNKIADAFEIQHRWNEGIETMQDEEGSQKIGDGLTAYEEYRGFMLGGEGGVHITTDPEKLMNLFVYCVSAEIKSNLIDKFIVEDEIRIIILDEQTDFVNATIKVINPNRGEWSVCEQHGLAVYHYNLSALGSLGVAYGELGSPKSNKCIGLDLNKIASLGWSKDVFNSIAIHEFMHGCGVHHHGELNEDIEVNGKTKSIALWNGVNAGNIECVMVYGHGKYFKQKNGELATDERKQPIPFINTFWKRRANELCVDENGQVGNKSSQLGSAEKGNCLSQVHVSDE